METLSPLSSIAIVLLAAAVHASFQLSISVLTVMSGHALGRKTARIRLINMIGGFVFGAGIMTVLLVSVAAYLFGYLMPWYIPPIAWALLCGAAVGVGISVWLFYYQAGHGTMLWIPRILARYLEDRAKSTKSAGETFGLGLSSVASEFLFILTPVLISALVLIRLPYEWQITGILLYAGISLLPLLVVGLLIGGGRKISSIQHWRERNKRFLQFSAGTGLLILGAYLYVERIVVPSVLSGGL